MRRQTSRLTILIPTIVFLTVAGMFAVLWRAVLDRAVGEIDLRTDLTAEQIASRLAEHFKFRIDLLRRIAHDWETGYINSAEDFDRSVRSALFDSPELSSVAWLDEAGQMRWVVSFDPETGAAGHNLTPNGLAHAAFRKAVETGRWTLTPLLDLRPGENGVVAYLPLSDEQQSHGALSTTIHAGMLIEACLASSVRDNFTCSVWDGGELIYGEGPAAPAPSRYTQTRPAILGQRSWDVSLTPNAAMLGDTLTGGIPLIMVLGLLAAGGLAFVSARLLTSQARLRENEERLRAVAEHIPGVIYSYESTPGRPRSLIYLGPGLASIIGPVSAAAVAKNFDLLFDRIHPEDRPRVAEAARRGEAGDGTVDCEARLQTDDGSYRWIRSLSRPLPIDRDVTRWHIVLIDITEHRKIVDALRESEERYRLLIESSPVGVMIHRDGMYQFVNPAALRLLGYERSEDLVGRSVFDIVPPERHEAIRARIAALGAQTHSVRFEDERLLRRDGSILNVEVIVSTINFAGGPARQVLILDVTEQRQAERRQHLLMRELDHRVKNNLASVLALLDQTAASTRDIDEFRRKFADRIKAMARTHEMLARTKWSGVDLAEIVRLCIAPYVVEQGHRVRLDGLPIVIPPRPALPIGLALHELATNAIKHGSLSTPQGRIRISWERHDGHIQLHWVEADGPPAATPRDHGTGLCLVRGLVEFELGGTVDFQFNPEGLECMLSIDAAAFTDETR